MAKPPKRVRRDSSGLRQVLYVLDRSDLDLARSQHRIRAALHPCDGLVRRSYIPEPESGDQFSSRGERSRDDLAARAGERNTRGVGREQKAENLFNGQKAAVRPRGPLDTRSAAGRGVDL